MQAGFAAVINPTKQANHFHEKKQATCLLPAANHWGIGARYAPYQYDLALMARAHRHDRHVALQHIEMAKVATTAYIAPVEGNHQCTVM